jgi:outer membrane cobalamin receptor
MLMFVGEARPTTTVASRSPESPVTAPALVTIVDRALIERNGYRTLADLLADQPGFYMAPGGRGTVPYLRGLRDAVLFLYDGVPMTTDVTKSFAPLDREISLDMVERVEIVRGAASVLWGPDAFAGVVNIVPRRGTHGSLRSAAEGGTDDLYGGHLAWSGGGRRWDAYLGFSGVRRREPHPRALDPHVADRSTTTVDPSHYAELVGTLSYGDSVRISGRWSDFTRRYTMRAANDTFSWAGARETPVKQIKLTANRVMGAAHLSLTGSYQQTDYRVLDADVERSQRNSATHLELHYDRRLFGRGLLTLGVSWRDNRVTDAVVRDGFLPDFLKPENDFFVPEVRQADYTTRRLSPYAQYRYKWGSGQWWAGLRYDDHSQYAGTLSWNLGALWRPTPSVHIKTALGTAHRSPWSEQLFSGQSFDPESIRTASAQILWQPAPRHALEMTLFHSRLQDHRAEDPYGGLSLPSGREVYGAELEARLALRRRWHLEAGLSWHQASGHDTYRVLAFSVVRPDGSEVAQYDQWREPSDSGPRWLARLGLEWRPRRGHSLRLVARKSDSIAYSYARGARTGQQRQPLLVDLVYRRPGFLAGRDHLTLRITNLFDRDYQVPDLHGLSPGPPLQGLLLWEIEL